MSPKDTAAPKNIEKTKLGGVSKTPAQKTTSTKDIAPPRSVEKTSVLYQKVIGKKQRPSRFDFQSKMHVVHHNTLLHDKSVLNTSLGTNASRQKYPQ